MLDPKETTELNEISTEVEVENENRNDKRYEEPFEMDGAYADDDIED